jgi:hypothetical protein
MDIDLLKARVQALAHLSTSERARLCNMAEADLRNVLREKMLLSDLPMFLSVDGAPARRRMVVPFYTVWSAYEGKFCLGMSARRTAILVWLTLCLHWARADATMMNAVTGAFHSVVMRCALFSRPMQS